MKKQRMDELVKSVTVTTPYLDWLKNQYTVNTLPEHVETCKAYIEGLIHAGKPEHNYRLQMVLDYLTTLSVMFNTLERYKVTIDQPLTPNEYR